MFSRSVIARNLSLPALSLLLVAGLGAGPAASAPTFETAATTAAAAVDKPGKAVTAREVATAWLDARAAGATPEELAKFFDKDADWYIQGDEAVVPWLGHKEGRAEFAEHFAQLEQLTRAESLQVDSMIGDGDRVIVLGTFRVTILATGETFDSEFAFDITVDKQGEISRYRALEDSWALSEAYRP